MENTFQFEILTPQKTVYQGEVSSLVAPEVVGSFGVRVSHAPLVSRSAGGQLKIEELSKTKRYFKVGPGLIEVLNNRVIILTKEVEEVPGT